MEGDGPFVPRCTPGGKSLRGARGRGRGGGRGGGRGRGKLPSRGRGKRTTGTQEQEALDQNPLGSNEYRFQNLESSDSDHDSDSGADFEEAARGSMYDPNAKSKAADDVDVLTELVADFSGLEDVLETVPLWIRLGDQSKGVLGVPPEETIDRYLQPFDVPSEKNAETGKGEDSGQTVLDDIAGLSLDDNDTDTLPGQDDVVPIASGPRDESSHRVQGSIALEKNSTSRNTVNEREEPQDEFDKWLDEI